eukprot:261081-Rhodomonas_salina.2
MAALPPSTAPLYRCRKRQHIASICGSNAAVCGSRAALCGADLGLQIQMFFSVCSAYSRMKLTYSFGSTNVVGTKL